MATLQKIVPNLWFDGNAKEAVGYYVSVFKDAKIVNTSYYPTEGLAEFQQAFAGKELTVDFELFGQRFTAINAGSEFKFNEAISLLITCEDQDEIDYYWEKLTDEGGTESVCGWLKDKYGLSWQVAPKNIDELVAQPGGFARMMQMKKIDIAELEAANERK